MKIPIFGTAATAITVLLAVGLACSVLPQNETGYEVGTQAHAGESSSAPLVNLKEETWRIKDSSFGCKSSDDYSKLIGFYAAGDDAAALKFITPRTLAGTCKTMQPGKVFIEESSIFGNPCVRKRGDVDCFYTSRMNLAPVK